MFRGFSRRKISVGEILFDAIILTEKFPKKFILPHEKNIAGLYEANVVAYDGKVPTCR